MQKVAKLALSNTLALQTTVMDLLDNVGKDVKALLNGTVVPDSVLHRHSEQDIDRRDNEDLDS